MVITRGWRSNSVNNITLGRLKTVGFKGSLSIEIWVEIQGCVRMRLVILNLPGEDLEHSSNHTQKVFSRMKHVSLVVGNIILEFLPEFLHLEEHCFGFMGHRISEGGNGTYYVVVISFEQLSGLNRSVGSGRGWIFSGDIIRENNSGIWVWNGRVQGRGHEVQG